MNYFPEYLQKRPFTSVSLVKVAIAVTLVNLLSACHSSSNHVLENNPALGELLQNPVDPADILLLVDKSDRRLTLFHLDKAIKSYPVVLGGNPVDDKRREGDLCTPEGDFGIRNLYPHPRWTYFVWIDYPNEESWAKHRASLECGEIPNDATIGGEVGIHGVPEGADYLIEQGENWTLGCVSLTNTAIAEIFPYLSTASKIRIQP